MTAPFVATVTKQPGGAAGRCRLQRVLLITALLVPLLLALALLAWMVVPKAGEGDHRAAWIDRMLGSGDGGAPREIEADNSFCSLPKEIGPCRAAMPRFFYSTDSGKCESFIYGGCDGNANNFETAEECARRCGGEATGTGQRQVSQRDDCSLPKKIGPCRGAMPRFFYSTESGTCETFLYGGCEGNANNFETAEECSSRCGGEATSEGQRKDLQHNENSAAICSLQPEAGICMAAMPRYYFDTETSTCQEFTYGGCKGNGNNFETLHDCEKMCSPAKKAIAVSPSDCSSEPDGGRCMAYMERYAYHPETQSCEKFIYGGCGGNGNRYSSVEECKEHCAEDSDGDADSKQKDDCSLPKKVGPCRAAWPRFFYNTESEKCEAFIYGGCAGNANNFKTVEECNKKCGGPGGETRHDSKFCGVTECPADCGFVRRDADCVLCQCSVSPFPIPGEPDVPDVQPVPVPAV